jgi:hypothetical protein
LENYLFCRERYLAGAAVAVIVSVRRGEGPVGRKMIPQSRWRGRENGALSGVTDRKLSPFRVIMLYSVRGRKMEDSLLDSHGEL